MNYLKLVENYVTEYYKEFCDNRFKYHNIDHIKDVVRVVEEIGVSYNLNNSEMELIKIAAWFHDIGHLSSKAEHERISANFAKVYLEIINYPIDEIDTVVECIKATDLNVEPKNTLEKIIKDADLFHLGSNKYFNYSDKLFDEITKRKICLLSYDNWIESSIKFFKNHNYLTAFASNAYEKQKIKNLEKLNSILSKNTFVPKSK